MASTRAHLGPDIVDDRVQKEGALQPRLVPLLVHESGVHGLVQELLVEQDAVDVLHCGSTQNSSLDQKMAISAVLIIVFHPSSVLVTVCAKKKNDFSRRSFGSLTGIRRYFAGSRLCVARTPGANEKTPVHGDLEKMHRATSENAYTKAWFDYCRSVSPQSVRKASPNVDLHNVSKYQCSILFNNMGSFSRRVNFGKLRTCTSRFPK